MATRIGFITAVVIAFILAAFWYEEIQSKDECSVRLEYVLDQVKKIDTERHQLYMDNLTLRTRLFSYKGELERSVKEFVQELKEEQQLEECNCDSGKEQK
jgi:hypothetical protein